MAFLLSAKGCIRQDKILNLVIRAYEVTNKQGIVVRVRGTITKTLIRREDERLVHQGENGA